MPFSVKFRELLDPGAEREFDGLVKRLREFLLTEHNEDGTHLPNAQTFPVGSIMQYAGATAPTSGWLICDGTAVSRATYSTLLDVIGTAYGVGDGSTTFNLPDLRQRFPLGKAASGTGNALGATGGVIDHTHSGAGLSTQSAGSHSHTVAGHTHSISAVSDHSHTVNNHSHSISSDGSHSHSQGAHNHAISSVAQAVAGSDVTVRAHQTQVDIFNDSGTSSNGSHDHGGSTGNQNPGTSSGGGHDHGGASGSASPSTDTGGAHTHTMSGSVGANNPPYVVVNYIIFTGVS